MDNNEQSMELESLGFIVKKRNDIDTKEVDGLINLLKMELFRDYKTIYNEE
jgi:hypothetical protein